MRRTYVTIGKPHITAEGVMVAYRWHRDEQVQRQNHIDALSKLSRTLKALGRPVNVFCIPATQTLTDPLAQLGYVAAKFR